ncbi:metal-dependent phosphohydrolase, HD subdomain protein [Kineosporia sp. NBRC 101677]|uniref:HD domain-containing protein n=1 Tax=Kineosporia sp. NBRC 101677 TaxID=3032197 RepID=UPI0024A0ECB2|nr:HD domain-containing protein [Kineosporia sp. NBRC 101677]GLY18004.1 metal-dependent phosphohydrolase, HD subdomain protein [Kineosporia sp. NBRC 101677]
MTSTSDARDLADHLLAAALPRRWNHTQGVAARAATYARALDMDVDTCEAAAWLHDIGYGPEAAVTGFHPLDGARHLRDNGYPLLLCELVAHHSGALTEAEERGLADLLVDEFGPADRHRELLSLVTAADMTTTPDGNEVAVETRISEILARYEAGDPVHRAVSRSGPELIAATNQILEAVRNTTRP